MKAGCLVGPFLWLVTAASVSGATYRVETLEQAPPKADLPAAIAGPLESTGLRLIRGTQVVFCDLWLCKNLAVIPDFQPTGEINYPFRSGQFLGVVRFSRAAKDFRNQELVPGLYTIRYGCQPVDGNHEGTFASRDFLLLLRAQDDQSPDLVTDDEELSQRSGDAVDSTHPAMFPLLKPSGEADATTAPSLVHDVKRDWWILSGNIRVTAGTAVKEIPLAVVAVGVVDE